MDDSASFVRYLAAKKTVDDRALNRPVWEALAREVAARPSDRPFRVLEVGAGVGTMVERAVDWGLFNSTESPRVVAYTAIDAQERNVAEAGCRLPRWAAERGFATETTTETRAVFARPNLRLTLELEAVDLFDFAARERGRRRWDLVVAQALLDVLDAPAALAALFGLLNPGGLFYAPITFDGGTVFEPEIDRALDDQIASLYHRTMDRGGGEGPGDSRTGRRLFGLLRDAGAEVLAMGSSDWVVFPRQGSYPGDEAAFLHQIVGTVDSALAGHAELDAGRFADWVARRHAQIERGELVYVAHQLDVLGRTSDE